MSEVVGVVCMSHAPFWDPRHLGTGSGGTGFDEAAVAVRAAAVATRPTLVVAVGPDHFRNFFYDMMPPFCIGADRVTSFGDFRTPRGPLPTAPAMARSLHAHITAGGFDPALSLHMGVDHGIVQSYAALFPALDVPLVPIMVACTGAATPTVARCAAFGQALGRAVHDTGSERVLLVASGGLSHWLPPTDPDHPDIDPELRDFVVDGRPTAREVQAQRETRLMAIAATLSGRVNDSWDRWFLEHLARGDADALQSLTSQDIERDAGNGGQEVRTWLIAAAAWGAPIATVAYEPRPDWLTGMGCAAAFT